MKKRNRIVVSFLLAFVFIFATALTGCDTDTSDETSEYTVTFDFNDGNSRPLQKRVEKTKALAAAPSTPSLTGNTFANWYTAAVGGDLITFPYTPTEDVTFYAHWNPGVYTVSFDNNYEGAPAAATQNISYKQAVSKPAEDPIRSRYSFFNWFTASEGGDIVQFPYTVKKDTTFFAHWVADDVVRHTVHFDLNYTDAPAMDSVEYIEGIQAVNMPTAPTRAGFAFRGWFEEPTGGTAIKFPYVPTEESTLYAQWAAAAYSITLKTNYGVSDSNTYMTIAVAGGDDETLAPVAPERENYTFSGWWTNARGGTEITFPAVFVRTATYYAHWTSVKVITNVFQAEYTEFDLTRKFQGYSGSVTGTAAIDPDLNNALKTSIDRGYKPEDVGASEYIGYYVTYLYNRGDSLVFDIYSSKAVSNVTLSARLAGEIKHFTIGPETGPLGMDTFPTNNTFSYTISVNDNELDYTPIVFNGYPTGPGAAGEFKDYTISTTISLNEGFNRIVLLTNNATLYMGGTMYAVAPMVDYISLTGTDAELSWYPIYENLGYIS